MVTLFCGFGYMVVLLFVLICLWLRKKGVARFSALQRFKDNLVSARKMHGFSQDELAEKIGVSRQTLSKCETGGSQTKGY